MNTGIHKIGLNKYLKTDTVHNLCDFISTVITTKVNNNRYKIILEFINLNIILL